MKKFNVQDFYFKKAKKENFVARSVFKLEEIQERYRVLREGDYVADLGCAPGSWSQYTSKLIGPAGRILGIDLQEMLLTLPNAQWVQSDLVEYDYDAWLKEQGRNQFDVVLSDMAPKTTGVRFADQERSFQLCNAALEVARKHLKPGGGFVVKFFHSDSFEALRKDLKANFKRVELLKPKSTRKESKEIFLIGLGKKTA